MSWAWNYQGLNIPDNGAEWRHMPLASSPIRQEIMERAEWNWDVWGQPDERMARPFWYFRINQRRRVKPKEKYFRDFFFRELYNRPRHDRWWKHFQGTEEFNEAIAKGERPNPIIRMGRTHGVITPREFLDAQIRHKINTWRHINATSYLLRQYQVDSFAREADPQVPFPVRGRWKRRWFKYIRPLNPLWWVPRLISHVRYALVGGRMPWLLWADQYRYFYRRAERVEWRKSRRNFVRQNTTDPTKSLLARERYAGIPARLRPLAGYIYRSLDRNFLKPMIQPAYGRLLTATFIKIPLLGVVAYSTYTAFKNTSNALADSEPNFAERLRADWQRAGDPYIPASDEIYKEHLEYRYPRKLK
eukprot:TRINITY_DN207_c0_g2_i1.p1 TRINITY_DN207_c0_g2~~TRINITY_DN207_c0_g2_i1.p1  ORF type:complete len:360 (-),score=25.67 TRINITY_DN207_c0_g2_i1:87-1166(-)